MWEERPAYQRAQAKIIWVGLLLLLAGCAARSPTHRLPTTALPSRLDLYFERYCDYSGSLGIGFDPSQTYDYRFRQWLKMTSDPELKRLFVLQHLHREVECALADYQRGVLTTGKMSARPLTLEEWQSTRSGIRSQIDDLAAFSAFTNFSITTCAPLDRPDPGLDADWIGELRDKLRSVTNRPVAGPAP